MTKEASRIQGGFSSCFSNFFHRPKEGDKRSSS